jgi:DNA polymerase
MNLHTAQPITTVSTGYSHVVVDVETRSPLNLAEVGASRYAKHPDTEVLVVAFACDDEEPLLWFPRTESIPPELIAVVADPEVSLVSHGGFESEIFRHILGPRFKLPEIAPERWIDTLTAALTIALPPALENLAIALDLKFRKDTAGARLMRQMAKPDSVAQDTPERLHSLSLYCARDVLATREAFYLLPALPEEERDLWLLNERINQRGVHFDRGLTIAARGIAEQVRPELNASIAEATSGEITSTSQVARIKRWLNAHRVAVNDIGKDTIDELLASDLPPEVRRVVELRQAGAGSATAKFDAIINGLDDDDRARGLFRWHGASTGRASSHRVQLQNFKHTSLNDPEAAIAAILSGDLARVRAIGEPLKVLANVLRPTICAGAGNMLVGADLSSVESRVLAYLAREDRKLEVYRTYDRTGDLEPYLVVARWLNPVQPDRAIGKIADLAFGYMGGVRAFRNFEPDKLHPLPEQKIEQLKLRWRRLHPNVERYWYALANAAVAAVFHPGQTTRAGLVRFKVINDFLYLQLPSGRLISYPYPRLEYDHHRRKRVTFKDNAAGGWRDDRLYGGQLAENVVSGAARDLLAAAMLRIEAAGISIVGHIHDELIAEIPEGTADLALLHKLMVEPPPWAPDLPIAAKVWTGRRYTK